MERLASAAREHELKVSTSVRVGCLETEVVEEASAVGANMITVVEQGRAGRLGFGENSLGLVRASPVPVWVIRSPLPRKRRQVLAAVDLTPRGHPNHRLNRRILEVGARFACAENAVLHVVHASPERGDGFPAGRTAGSELHERKRRRLESLVSHASLRDVQVELRVESGLPETLVPAAAQHLDADVVVLGTRCEIRDGQTPLGSVAEPILRRLDRSVVTVSPTVG